MDTPASPIPPGMTITVVSVWDAGSEVSYLGDVLMTKAAVLYADRVEVLSLSSVALSSWQAYAPDEELLLQRILAGDPIRVEDLPSFTPQSPRIAAETGIAEMLPALNSGLLVINQDIPTAGDMTALFHEFIRMAVSFLYDPTRIVLLDPKLSDIVRTAAKNQGAPPPDRAVANAREAVIGAGLIARLPTFTVTPMSELLDLRTDLSGPLARYRKAVGALQQEIALDPYVAAREADVDALWRTRVQAELAEIEEALRTHALVREVARHVGMDVKSLLAGAAGGIGVAFTGSHDVAVAAGGAVASMVNASAAVPKAIVASRDGKAEVGRKDFYYLYRLGHLRRAG